MLNLFWTILNFWIFIIFKFLRTSSENDPQTPPTDHPRSIPKKSIFSNSGGGGGGIGGGLIFTDCLLTVSAFSFYVEDIRFFISSTFNFEIFPEDIYFLDELPSEIDPISISIIFLFSIFITALASFFPAKAVSKMDTIKALKYE